MWSSISAHKKTSQFHRLSACEADGLRKNRAFAFEALGCVASQTVGSCHCGTSKVGVFLRHSCHSRLSRLLTHVISRYGSILTTIWISSWGLPVSLPQELAAPCGCPECHWWAEGERWRWQAHHHHVGSISSLKCSIHAACSFTQTVCQLYDPFIVAQKVMKHVKT